MGIQSSRKLARMVQILHNSEQGMVNWVDFAQFAVNFEGSIFHRVNWKMAGEICVIC